jgi:hypothetical protein
MTRIVLINGRVALPKRFKEFLKEKHDTWDLVSFEMLDEKFGASYHKDATINEARILILKQMLLDKKCDAKLLEQFEGAVRDEARDICD